MALTHSDPHMISDAALDAWLSDADLIARNSVCPHTGEIWVETLATIREHKPAQERPFLLATKRCIYRETGAYTQAVLNERMRNKPRPKARPMAGFGSRAYRSW